MKSYKLFMFLSLLLFSAGTYAQSLISSIQCDDFGSGFICEAGPFSLSDEYSYFWRSSAPQPRPGPFCGDEAFCYEGCLQGSLNGSVRIDVTVTDNTTGLSDSASKNLQCGNSGFGF